MIKLIGWTFLIANFLWFAIVPFSKTEPTITQAIGSAACFIGGAILINKR